MHPTGFALATTSALVFSLAALGPASAARLAAGSPEPFFFGLSRIEAVSLPKESATQYSVTVTNPPVGNAPASRWYLHLKPAGSSARCTNGALLGGTPVSGNELVWKNLGPRFVWYHGAKGGCDQTAIGHGGYPGTVTVVFENDAQHCTATFAGIPTGSAPEYGPPAVCALGGYLPLPVPRRLLQIYTNVDTGLTALIQRARAGKVGARGATLDRDIASILQPQRSAFTHLFPPVWGCSFNTLFDRVLQVKSALEGQSATLAADARYLDAMAASLSACKPSPTRPLGVPNAVLHAVDELRSETTALRTQKRGTALSAKLQSLDRNFDAIVSRSFPVVFGMPYGVLLDRVQAEDSAIAVAERAAEAGHTGAVATALARATGPERTIGHALRTQAKRSAKAQAAA
jgi:hypothetical protein